MYILSLQQTLLIFFLFVSPQIGNIHFKSDSHSIINGGCKILWTAHYVATTSKIFVAKVF